MKEAEVPVYFFDTSALVKRYHQEAGTGVVDLAFGNEDATKLISDLSVIECYSAFAKKARMGEITAEDFRVTIETGAADIRGEAMRMAIFGDDEKKEAVALIEKYGVSKNLRALDAMQLAVMKKLGPQAIEHVYCADHRFAAAIRDEGFFVIDPEETPSAERKE